MNLRRLFLWSMIVSLAAAALLGIAAFVLPSSGPGDRILISTALFAGFSIAAMMSATVLERRRLVPMMWLGIASALGAMAVWVTLIWFNRRLDFEQEEAIARIGGTMTVLGLLVPHVGLLAMPRFDSQAASLARWLTVGVAVLLALVILDLVWEGPLEDALPPDALRRILGVLTILVACGTVVTPILCKVQAVARAESRESIPSGVTVELTCPRCRTAQTLRAGPGRRCCRCGLRIGLDVEEPRCVCGYLLHRLASDRCPECGRTVAEADRWAAAAPEDSRTVPLPDDAS